MKIITLQRLTNNGEPVYEEEGDTRDWFCVIETEEEQMVYDKFVCGDRSSGVNKVIHSLWNAMVIHAGEDEGLAWGDDDVWGYFSPSDTVPEVGEQWTDGDGDRWGRVK